MVKDFAAMKAEIKPVMTCEEVNDLVDRLMAIDDENLDASATETTRIFSVLQYLYMVQARRLSRAMNDLKKVEHHRRRRYEGKLGADHYKNEPLTEAVLKTDIDRWLGVDEVVTEARELFAEQDRIVKLIEGAMKQLNSRTWDIKNAVAYKQMLMGTV